MKIPSFAITNVVVIAALTASTFAAGESEKKMFAEAKIDRTHAENIAMSAAHGGTIKSGELEREKGHLVWSFDIVKPNTSGITEVLLDAKTGKILAVQKENAAHEAAEAKAEAREKKH